MTVQELIDALKADGWELVNQQDLLKQLRHQSKIGTVTVSGKDNLRVPPGVLQCVWGLAKLKETS